MNRLVSLNIAELARKKGFNEDCDYLSYDSVIYNKETLDNCKKYYESKINYLRNPDKGFYIPTRDHLLEWMRGNRILVIPECLIKTNRVNGDLGVVDVSISEYIVRVRKLGRLTNSDIIERTGFRSWNSALDEGLRLGLNMI